MAPGELGTVTKLHTTPVKGLHVVPTDEIELTPTGARGNRVFFLVDESATLVNGKRLGPLTAVVATYDPDTEWLELRFPDGSAVSAAAPSGPQIETNFFSIPLQAEVVPGSFSEALSDYAGIALRLVRADPARTAIDRGPEGSVSLISEGSVEHLSTLAGAPVDSRRFRMMIEVAGPAAHAEDALVGARARVGEALVAFQGHVGRCLVTGRNPDTGAADLPTLGLLSYRRGLDTTEPLAFGIYGEVLEPGRVRVGDAITISG
jgi:uncharacterized protein YcbX